VSFPRLIGAQAAQWLAQALTLWAFVVLLLQGVSSSSVLLLVALLVPFRSDGSAGDRAVANFASGLIVWGVLITRLYGSFLDTIIWGPGDTVVTTFNLTLLTMAVLYMFAGAFLWVERKEEDPE